METRIQKWGNSLGLRIPRQLAKDLHLYAGAVVHLKSEGGRLFIDLPLYDLNTMVDAITPENSHHLQFDGEARGQEEW